MTQGGGTTRVMAAVAQEKVAVTQARLKSGCAGAAMQARLCRLGKTRARLLEKQGSAGGGKKK